MTYYVQWYVLRPTWRTTMVRNYQWTPEILLNNLLEAGCTNKLCPFQYNQRHYTCIAWHCQCVPTFAHQLHDLSKFMSSDSPCNLYSRVTRLSDISDISRMTTTLHISRWTLLFEFPLKSSDLYRISPNIPQTLCHPSKGEIVPINSRYLIACNSVFSDPMYSKLMPKRR